MAVTPLTSEQRALCEEYAARLPNLSRVAWMIHSGMHRLIRHHGNDNDDIHSIAWTGVIDAAKKFDPRRGANFQTLAAWYIKNAMHYVLASARRDKRNPERGEIVRLTGQEQVECRRGGIEETNRMVNEVLAALPDDQRRLLEMRYGLNGVKRLPHRDLARRLGVTHQTVSTRLRKAKAAAREILEAD